MSLRSGLVLASVVAIALSVALLSTFVVRTTRATLIDQLDQQLVETLANYPRLVLLCGRYEGFDERISEGLQPLEISVGDFVCNGGEVPAMIILETVMRLIPGLLGDDASAREDSFSRAGQLEFPQYTRPREYRGMQVPDVLLSGDHQEIARWRHTMSDRRTRERRPQS